MFQRVSVAYDPHHSKQQRCGPAPRLELPPISLLSSALSPLSHTKDAGAVGEGTELSCVLPNCIPCFPSTNTAGYWRWLQSASGGRHDTGPSVSVLCCQAPYRQAVPKSRPQAKWGKEIPFFSAWPALAASSPGMIVGFPILLPAAFPTERNFFSQVNSAAL